MKNLFDVSNRVILITGSSRGLGFAFASGFAEAGARVIVNGTRSETVDPAVARIREEGGDTTGYPFDVTDPAQVERCVAAIEREVGPIEVLVNNAGSQRRAPLEEQTLADWRAVLEVNLNAVFVVSQCVGKRMIERRRGAIINITSLNAEGARPTIAPYCASKGGLTLFTQSLATEWGQYGIRANAIAPGYFITEMTQPLADDPTFDAWVKGNVPLALASLERALALAEPEGYVRIFVDEGPPMAALLQEAAKHGIAPNYVRQLRAAFEQGGTPATHPLIEPLSERELEVLKLLGTELSGPEIARELMVSLNTMRTHTKNIYSKLGVNNRRAAVRRAEELDLL